MKGIENTMVRKEPHWFTRAPLTSITGIIPNYAIYPLSSSCIAGTWHRHRISWSDTELRRFAVNPLIIPTPNAIYLTSFAKMVERSGSKRRKGKLPRQMLVMGRSIVSRKRIRILGTWPITFFSYVQLFWYTMVWLGIKDHKLNIFHLDNREGEQYTLGVVRTFLILKLNMLSAFWVPVPCSVRYFE